MSENLDSIITELNLQKQRLTDAVSKGGAIPTNTSQYWMPYYSVLALFNGLSDSLTEISKNTDALEEKIDTLDIKTDTLDEKIDGLHP